LLGRCAGRGDPVFASASSIQTGSGLGLSQVYGFAKQSGGATLIDSEIGKGTTITLHLPRAAIDPAAPEAAVAEDVPAAVSARILLVEDDREVANVTTELLQDIGCQVVQAHDGTSALVVLERDPEIELVMSDIAMPGGMSGLELARIVRERHRLPILLATGYSQYAMQVMNEDLRWSKNPITAMNWSLQSGQPWNAPFAYDAPRNRATLAQVKRGGDPRAGC